MTTAANLPRLMSGQDFHEGVSVGLFVFRGMETLKVVTLLEKIESQGSKVLSERRGVMCPGHREDVVCGALGLEGEVAGLIEVEMQCRHRPTKSDLPA
jgi:hypothetical protein